MLRCLRPALGLAVGLLSLSTLAGAQAPAYHAVYLGSATDAAAMNESGIVVGTGAIGIHPRAYFAGPTQPITYLPLPFGFISSEAFDINDAGVIVGVISPYQTPAFYPQPARWDPNGSGGYTATLLLTLPGDNRGTADAINNLGDIVGTSSYQSSTHTVLYAPSGTVELAGMAGIPPWSLNDSRVYVGGNGVPKLVNLNTLAVQDLGFPSGTTGSHGYVINASGQVAGDLTLSGGPSCAMEAALFTVGPGWQAVSPCGSSNSAWDLNTQGDVLMKLEGVPWVRFSGAGLHRVEDLIVGGTGHWTASYSIGNIALNDARQMALYATNGGQTGIILITPEPGQICQADLGYGGPGALALSVCGGNLATGTTADLLVTGAQPAATVWLLVGLTQHPTAFKGGTLVPVPLLVEVPLVADGVGHAAIPGIPGGNGPFSVYLQSVMHDVNQPLGWDISNAVRMDFLP